MNLLPLTSSQPGTSRSLLRGRVLCQGLGSGGETIADCGRDLWSWVDDHLIGTWLCACFVCHSAILSGVADERQRLGPTFDLRCNGSHPLGGRGTHATTVVPSRAVAWGTGFSFLPGCDGELGIIVHRALEDGLLGGGPEK